MHSALRVAVATVAFAALHSTLASRRTKRLAAGLVGERNQRGLYRSAFVAQSVITSAALAEYIRRQPDQTLYDLPAPWRYASRAAQLACAGLTVWSAYEAGIARLSGAESFTQWKRGMAKPVEPAAQGPSADSSGELHVRGPFRWSRHPLNFWPWLMLVLNPRMTRNTLTLVTTSGCYLALGSVHEETRLARAHGSRYTKYQRSGVPFYLPRLPLFRLSARRQTPVVFHEKYRPADDRRLSVSPRGN